MVTAENAWSELSAAIDSVLDLLDGTDQYKWGILLRDAALNFQRFAPRDARPDFVNNRGE